MGLATVAANIVSIVARRLLKVPSDPRYDHRERLYHGINWPLLSVVGTDAYGAWVESIPSAIAGTQLYGVFLDGSGVDSVDFQIGTGAAGSETPILTLSVVSGGTPHVIPFRDIATGTRVSVRLKRKTGTASVTMLVSLLWRRDP